MRESLITVMTTIQSPTKAMQRLGRSLSALNAKMIVVGDEKGPQSYDIESTEFFAYAAQGKLPFRLAHQLPANTYSRKNLGYLLAVARGATCIYDTDDDNEPCAHWAIRSLVSRVDDFAHQPWINVYEVFSHERIWPRGLPLEYIRSAQPDLITHDQEVEAPVQQVLVDVSPDVDAMWRLLYEEPFRFDQRGSVRLLPGSWSPFNSQATWWWRDAYPLLYLPTFCNARVADIWRSFVAQRCLWALGYGLVFHSPDVEHFRNEHDLLRDLEAEVIGYLKNAEIASRLDTLQLSAAPAAIGENVQVCYDALIEMGVLPVAEAALVNLCLQVLQDALPR